MQTIPSLRTLALCAAIGVVCLPQAHGAPQMPALADTQAGEDWQGVDSNGDSAISLDEMHAQRASRFASLDADRNGRLDRTEMAAAHEQLAALAPNASGGRRGEDLEDRMFTRADRNGDGVLSQDEFVDAARPVFSHLDRNGDGLITAAEREALSQRLRSRRR